ncbi:hypothetical protein [Cellulomonas sp. PhB150]|uniref:hypothetical protein n=1 Tax=Cellulomonas sp. PhB150 TaxID=2485188 RepID=UPI000F96112E|nr:hypothetical protein [Cellulomonas sp. PhB150]ROS23950.1 hypothetical protein EDF34_3013 [Cellulomonas sp. PhB150]
MMTLTSLAPRPPVDPDGLEAAHRVLMARIDEERLAPAQAPRRTVRRWAVLAVGIAGVTAVAVTLPSGVDKPAFAGWTAVPAPIAPHALAVLGDACVEMRMSDLNAGMGPDEEFDLPGARGVVADRRGSIALTVVASPDGALICSVGPLTRKSSEVRLTGGGDTIEGALADSYRSTQGSETWTSAAPPADAVRLVQWNQQYAPEPWYSVVGKAGLGVRQVVVTRTEGEPVTASVANGFFVAWWPGDSAGASVVPVLEDGTKGVPLKLDVDDEPTATP